MYEQLRLLFSSRDCLNVLLPTEIVSVTFDGHFGALHRPRAGDVADMAIVICPAVGRDARCYLKDRIKPPRRKPGFISGVVR